MTHPNLIPKARVFKEKPPVAHVMDKEAKKHCPTVKFLTAEEWKEGAPNKEVPGIRKNFIFKFGYMSPIPELWIAKTLIRKYPSLDLVDKDMKSFNFEDDLDVDNVFKLKNIWLQYIFAENENADTPPLTKKELTRDIRKFRQDGIKPITYEELQTIRAKKKEKNKQTNRRTANEHRLKVKAEKEKAAEVV